MKAIRVHQFGDSNVMKLEDIPDPTPADAQVLIRTHAVGVNPVDTYIRAGIYGQRDFPFTPGMDAAGVVEFVGKGVHSFKPGDRVYTSGTLSGAYAQLVIAKESQVHPLPANITFEQGAALGVPYATAYYALFFRARALPAEMVLVHGATGGVGVAVVQLARSHGLTVFATGGTDRGRKLAIEQGAHYVLDHRAPDYLQNLMRLTGNRGVDLIIEMLANVNLANDLTVLSPRGRVIVIGSRGKIEIDPRLTMQRDADIRGMTLMNATETQVKAIHAALFAGLENGSLRPIVGQMLPLSSAAQSHDDLMKPGSHGKIVLIP
ncbi:MAG: NADPH:quinone reductase [Planctomycetota bacterium]|nr:NADPH:quinone reductase [Planctomycetota bacterium]